MQLRHRLGRVVAESEQEVDAVGGGRRPVRKHVDLEVGVTDHHLVLLR